MGKNFRWPNGFPLNFLKPFMELQLNRTEVIAIGIRFLLVKE